MDKPESEEIITHPRHDDNSAGETPRTDAILNTFDGNASKLAARLADHAEKLERELKSKSNNNQNKINQCLKLD